MAFDHQLNDALFRLSMNALKEKNSASAVVSPFSIAMALAAVNVGAKDKTSQEITEVAFDGIPKEKVTAWFRQKLDEMKKYSSPLAVASAVYLDKTLKMLENYKNDVAKNFDTVSQSADFRGNPRAERQTLNNYVEKNTGGHIKDLFGEDDITSDTRLVTVNAVYMKAAFHVRFQKEDTKEVAFHNEDGSIKQLQTMHDTKKGSFFKTDDFIYGHFAFVDYGFAFFVAVPKKSHLANLKESFTTSNQSFSSAHTGAEHVPYMHIALPKFNSEGSYKLKETLSQLGISQLFNSHGANLSGITNEQVHVEKVIHKAILELDEDGVTAAAVTAMGIEPMCLDMSREERNLKADRPFLYGVTYNGTPLFVGQYY